MKPEEVMDVEITFKAVIESACTRQDLAAMKMTLKEWCEYICKSEGICGVIDTDDIKIIDARFLHEQKD